MDKADNSHNNLSNINAQNSPEEKGITVHFTVASVVKCILCFVLGYASVFADMHPFSLGFYTAVFSREKWVLSLVLAISGVVFSGASYAWVYIAVLVSISAVLLLSDIARRIYARVIYCSGLFMMFRVVGFVFAGFSWFDFAGAVIECLILAGYIIIVNNSYGVILNPGKRTFISYFERMCIFVFVAVFIISLHETNIYGRVNLASVAAILCIYILCLSSNVECAAVFGIVMGVIVAMNTHPASDIAGLFGFGAMLGAVFGKFRKPGVVFGFILASTLFALLISEYERAYSGIGESLTAAAVLFFIPTKFVSYISSLFSISSAEGNNRVYAKMRRDDFINLRKMSESFRELSEIYSSCATEKRPGKNYIISKFDYISDKVCAMCPHRKKCFDFKSEIACENMTGMLEKAMIKGRITENDMPDTMKTMCHRKDGFVSSFNFMAELVRTERRWMGKISESRRLVADQMSGVADAIDKFCKIQKMQPNPALEEALMVKLDKNMLYPSGVSAYTDSGGDFNVYVSFRDGFVPGNVREAVNECIYELIHTDSRFVTQTKKGGEVTYLFGRQQKYSVSFGYASCAKDGEKESGDSFKVITDSKKGYIMVLSDGMGSGAEAKSESETAVGLLEKFLGAGFDCDTAVKLINSSLLLKSSKESFATLDICLVNPGEHFLSFIKLGAANTYVKNGDEVSVIGGRNLPAGILREIEYEKHMLPIVSDTVVVMISDGVGDTVIKSGEKSDWIEKEILRLSTSNPQIIAGKLLEKARRMEKNVSSDDMTVMVAYISNLKNNL